MPKHGAHTPHYRTQLQQTLEVRSARNPRYSLRSFARDLKLSPQRISDLIRGRYGLSAQQAEEIAAKLGLAGDELRRFVSSAEMHHARSPAKRKSAEAEFNALSAPISSLSLDSFQVISDWYHYAILELTYIKGFRSGSDWISQQLNLPVFVVEQAIERLKRLDLLEVDATGRMRCTQAHLATPSGIPSEALRKFHRQLMEKAIQALDFQTVEERDTSSVVMTIDRARMSEAKEDLKRFRREFGQKYGSDPVQSEVYCLGMQFFRLHQRIEEKES